MSKIEKLIEKGVKINRPTSVEIGDEVDVDRISADGVVIYAGCKIFGAETLILPGAKLGYEAPVTVDNCQVGPDVELKGGYFNQAVFLEKARLGLGSHIREATILEEQAVVAHTVGLKHTILFPFVTLGSLINFCDCLMAGGTSRKNHSEVGSSYIHFNFTPSQDKATASLIGDVPGGVMLNRQPIFLGGCAPTHVPEPLKEQLKEGGRMIIPVGEAYAQKLLYIQKINNELKQKSEFPVRFVPMINPTGKTY